YYILHNRTIHYRDHRFGLFTGQRSKPGTLTPGHYYRFHYPTPSFSALRTSLKYTWEVSLVILSQLYRSLITCRAWNRKRLANRLSERILIRAIASPSSSKGANLSPVSPSLTISASPPTSLTTTGVPDAMASRATIPNGS